MASDFDPYYKWLGIPPEEQPPHHYRLLAIKTFEADPDVIEGAADRLMAHLRTFQTGKNSALSQKLLNEVAAAKVCLLRPDKKAAYDAQLRELLNRRAAGEDTTSELQALRALGDVLGSDLARPASQRKSSAAGGSPWLGLGIGGAVLVAGVVAWRLFGVGGLKVAEKAEDPVKAGSEASAAQAQLKAAGIEPVVPPPAPPVAAPGPDVKAGEKPVPSATPSPVEDPRPSPPATMPVGQKPVAESQAKPGKGSSARATQPKPEEKPKPSPVSVATAGSPGSAAGAPQSPAPAISKRPVPSLADQEKSKKEAQDLFRDDYANAKKPSERAELARRILKKGVESRDPAAEHFALLLLARDVAISADDDRLAGEAIDETSKSFEVDSLAMKADALVTISKSARATLPLHKALCERALSLGQEALDQDKLELADTLAKLAYSEAAKVRDKDLVQRSRALAKDQQEAAKAYSVVQEAFKALKATPDDPAANAAAGKYLCFAKGDWPKGLLHLAKSNDAKLKPLAEEERRITPPEWEPAPGVLPPDPPPAAAALKLADSWWDAGQAASGKQRDYILRHAGYWYHQSFGTDTTAIAATKINTRLEQIDKIRRQYPAPPLAIAPFDAREARQHQRRWADYLGVPWVMTNSIGMKFVLIPPGEFMMGSSPEEVAPLLEDGRKRRDSQWYFDRIRGESPRHAVTITKAFWLSVFEATQAEYEQVMEANPSGFVATSKESNRRVGLETKRHPVDSVTWSEAKRFCQKLSDRRPQPAALRGTYRLPSEAEWEYACRAGTASLWSYGDRDGALGEYGWFKGNSQGMTHTVGQKRPNAWGLYDMQGNVLEFCQDWYDEAYYGQSPSVDPTGPSASPNCVMRGGSCGFDEGVSRPAFRHAAIHGVRSPNRGFRVTFAMR